MIRPLISLPLALILIGVPAVFAETDVEGMADYLSAQLNARVTGYSFAIVDGGQVAESRAGGIRKVGAAFETDTQVHVASVSKTVTAVAVLQLLEANGLSVFDSIGPWLPDDWVKGYGFWQKGGLRFIDLLTHRSGVQQSLSKYVTTIPGYSAGNSYDALQELVANGIAPDWKDTGCASKQDDGTFLPGGAVDPGIYFGGYCYKNANYALFRIILPKLWQAVEPSVDHLELNENLTAWLYVAYVAQNIWGPLDLQASCHAPDQDDKPQYFDARYPTAAPYDAWGNYSMFAGCGHVGWHLSSYDLAKFTTFLSHPEWLDPDQRILSVANRNLMDQYKLGWNKDSNTGDKAGMFYHGGDYYASGTAAVPVAGTPFWTTVPSSRESHACVIKFGDDVEASLVINSSIRGGAIWSPAIYGKLACGMLIDGYNAAQVVQQPGGGFAGGGTSGGGVIGVVSPTGSSPTRTTGTGVIAVRP